MLEVQVGKTLQRKQQLSVVPGARSPVPSEALVYVSTVLPRPTHLKLL